jgi:predicted dehydrogenase
MATRPVSSSRREFLENSMFAAAAAATAGAATGAFARTATAQESPNAKLRVAVVGVKSRGKSHIGGFANKPDSDVVVICDCDEKIGQSAAEKLKARYEKDVRKVVEDPNIDVITIATPNHWHSLMAIWAMQNGKDVYVEKPVSHNVSEGRRTVQAARKYNRICQTGTQSRSNPGTREAMAFLHEGGIGEVVIARGLCYKSRGSIGAKGEYSVPESVDYDLWTGPAELEQPLQRPELHYDWHWVWNTGNGDLGNQGIHQMDLARWGLGVEGVGESVESYGGRLGYEDAGETANTQVSIHQYPNNKRLVFEVRGLKTAGLGKHGLDAKVGVIFYGREGSLVLDSYSGGAAFDNEGNQIKKFGGGADHFQNFKDAVKSREVADLNADIEEGHLSSALCHLGNISYRLGEATPLADIRAHYESDPEAAATLKRVTAHLQDENGVSLEKTPLALGRKLMLDGEVFTGNDVADANAMLTRPYRDGYEVPSESNV